MFIKHWISIFGAPNYIFSDNGGEFIEDSFLYVWKVQGSLLTKDTTIL